MTKADEYGAALDDLDAMHRAGRISDARYELHKSKLLAEATRPKRSLPVKLLIFVGSVIALLLVLRFLVAIFNVTFTG